MRWLQKKHTQDLKLFKQRLQKKKELVQSEQEQFLLLALAKHLLLHSRLIQILKKFPE